MGFPFSRRDFLAAFAAPLFRLHPSYRQIPSLDAILQRRVAASDSFPLETEHDRIAVILATWQGDLHKSISKVLAPEFHGPSFKAAGRKVIRQSGPVQVEQTTFASQNLPRSEFLAELAELPSMLTAEFQITRIEDRPHGLMTTVRYEFVLAGNDFYREQRSGTWELTWSKAYEVLEWVNLPEIRSRSVAPVFADVTRHALGRNISYSEQLLHGVDYWRSILDGASHIDIYGHNGIAAGDIDGSGFDSLYICQPAGLPNRLFRNRGDGTFEDITEAAGVGVLENTACALFADFRNSGHQDLLVVRANGPLLFLNDGAGKFREKPEAFRFASDPQGTFTGAAIADYDRDGWLDVYFCLYVYYQGTGQYKYPTPYFDANNGPPNFLMRSNRDGTFRDVTAEAGLKQNNTRYSFCCAWTSSNDLYVVNDFGRKNLYRNNGDGTFTDIAALAGVEDVGAGMSICCFDYDNDGHEDLYVADMWAAAGERITMQPEFRPNSSASVRALYRKHAMGNSLFHNHEGSFEDKTQAAGVGMGRWSWSSDVFDFDHDGLLDLYVTNGMISGPIKEDLNSFFWRQVVAKSPDEAKPDQAYEQSWSAINELIRGDYSWSGYERNVFYANNGDGTFSDVSGAVGLDLIEDGRTFVLADIDHDGRLEIILKNRNAPQIRVLKNVIQDLPPSVSFRLRGTKSNRDAIGAVVTVDKQTRTVQAGSGFLAQHSKELLFGLGKTRGPIRASVRWPSGLVQTFDNVPANHRISIEEGAASFQSEPFRPSTLQAGPPAEPEVPPETVDTWLLSPIPAPGFQAQDKPVVLTVAADSGERAAVYNLLYRSLFDRHRDMPLPTYFLINEQGEIVRVGQTMPTAKDIREIPRTKEERIAKALPFAGRSSTFEFGRNHLSLGSVFFQHGYYGEAGDWFKLALDDDQSSAEAHYGVGSVYLKQGKTGEAQASFEQAVRLDASYPDTKANAWNNLGLIAAQQGQTERAIECFQKTLQLHPDYLIALQNMGNAYRQSKRWEEARSMLERALAVGPDEPEVNYSLAMVYAQTNRPDRAYQLLQRALQLRPNYPEAMNNLGVLYLRAGRRDEAVVEFEACIKTTPGFDQSYLNLARVYVIEGNREKARQILLGLSKVHPDQAKKALEEIGP